LAQYYYRLRVIELRERISEEEAKFKKLATEIDEIQAKKWDDKILAKLGLKPAEEPILTEEKAVEEAISEPAALVNTDMVEPDEENISADALANVHGDADTSQDATPSAVEEPPQMPVEQDPTHQQSEQEPLSTEKASPPPQDGDAAAEEDWKRSPSVESLQLLFPDEEEEKASEREGDVTMSEANDLAAQEDDEVSQDNRDTKRKASEESTNADEQRDRKRFREASEVGDDEEPGPSVSSRTRRKSTLAESQVVSKKFQNVIGMLHSTISQHRFGNIFHNPIRKSEAPDYHDIVKRPMDLKTIKTKVKDGVISNSLEFQRDIYLMFANAMMYNRPGSEIYNMAEEMMIESEGHITSFQQTEGFHRL